MATLIVRPETAEDENFLRDLTVAARWDEFAALPLPDAYKRLLLNQQHAAQRFHYRTHYAAAHFSIVEHDGIPIGRLCVLQQEHDHMLVDIALLPEFRGRGFGGALLDTIIADAAVHRRTVSLRVEHTNPARHLYERKGFRETERGQVDAAMEWRQREAD